MQILFLLVGASIVVAGLFLLLFLWSVKSGQYDDNYTPAIRILLDKPNKQSADTGDKTNSKP